MVLGIKEGWVECATVCVKSVVILSLNPVNRLSYQNSFWQKKISYLPIAVERTVVVVVAVTRQVTVEVLGWQLKKRRLRPVDDFDRFAAIKTKQKHISKQDKTTKITGA